MVRLSSTLAALVFSAAAVPASAQSEQYGDWTAYALSEAYFMATVSNNAGSVFGTICGPDACYAMLNPGIMCDEGARYPALVNAPSGSFPVDLLCEQVGELQIYSFPIGNEITEAMSIGGVLGIAFPMASGEFKVARFSLTGSARATARIQQLAQGLPRNSGRQNASDESTL